jgi:hypothetical protein
MSCDGFHRLVRRKFLLHCTIVHFSHSRHSALLFNCHSTVYCGIRMASFVQAGKGTFSAPRTFANDDVTQISIGLLAIGELVQLVLSSISNGQKTRTNLPSNMLAMTAAFLMLILSHFEHRKTFRPSSTLCTYLFISLLLDIPQARTRWMSHQPHSITDVFCIMIGLKILVLVLECKTKIDLLSSREQKRSPEETSNVFSRRFFWWLNDLFFRGYRKALLLPDLFMIDQDLSSETLGAMLEERWASRSKLSIQNWAHLVNNSRKYRRKIHIGLVSCQDVQMAITYSSNSEITVYSIHLFATIPHPRYYRICRYARCSR